MEAVDAVGKFADLVFQPFQRRAALGRLGQQIPHLFGLLSDAIKAFWADRGLGQPVDLARQRGNFTLQASDHQLRVVRLQARAQVGRHCVQRSDQRFGLASLTEQGDSLCQVSNRAFERDDRVAGREFGETAVHRCEPFPQRGQVHGADALILVSTKSFRHDRGAGHIFA